MSYPAFPELSILLASSTSFEYTSYCHCLWPRMPAKIAPVWIPTWGKYMIFGKYLLVHVCFGFEGIMEGFLMSLMGFCGFMWIIEHTRMSTGDLVFCWTYLWKEKCFILRTFNDALETPMILEMEPRRY